MCERYQEEKNIEINDSPTLFYPKSNLQSNKCRICNQALGYGEIFIQRELSYLRIPAYLDLKHNNDLLLSGTLRDKTMEDNLMSIFNISSVDYNL